RGLRADGDLKLGILELESADIRRSQTREAALVGGDAVGRALAEGGTAGQQRLGFDDHLRARRAGQLAAVVGQARYQRIERIERGANLIRGGREVVTAAAVPYYVAAQVGEAAQGVVHVRSLPAGGVLGDERVLNRE